MPCRSTTEFGVIDAYLSLKDQLESDSEMPDSSELISGLDEQLPLFASSFPSPLTPASAMDSNPPVTPPPSFFTSTASAQALQTVPQSQTPPSTTPPPPPPSSLLPQSESYAFLDMDSFYLEQLPPPPPSATSVLTPLSSAPPSPYTPAHSPSAPAATTFVVEKAGAGCTVVQTSDPEQGDQQLWSVEDAAMVDLCDLDKQTSLYHDDSSSQSDVKMGGVTSLEDWAVAAAVATDPLQTCSEAIDSLRADLQRDCKALNISPDPLKWNRQASQKWARYVMERTNSSSRNVADHQDCVSALAMSGRMLCSMTKEHFLYFSPCCGALLHQQLDLWKALAELLSDSDDAAQYQYVSKTEDLITIASAGEHSPLASEHVITTPSLSPAPSTDGSSSSYSSLASASSVDSLEDGVFGFAGNDPTSIHDSSPSSPSAQRPRARPRPGGKQIQLWEFLKELLEDGSDPCIKWLDRACGVFKIQDSQRVAKLWGLRKNRPAMNYDKLSRSVRQYYKKGIIQKTTQSRRLVYQFCERYL